VRCSSSVSHSCRREVRQQLELRPNGGGTDSAPPSWPLPVHPIACGPSPQGRHSTTRSRHLGRCATLGVGPAGTDIRSSTWLYERLRSCGAQSNGAQCDFVSLGLRLCCCTNSGLRLARTAARSGRKETSSLPRCDLTASPSACQRSQSPTACPLGKCTSRDHAAFILPALREAGTISR
jgi:hypothetical protein